jgi:AcrR family transcriptional regulator
MVERIVDAGLAVLLRDGYDAFSTNRVAAEAGISPGSLYQYFPDKAAIVDAVIERHWDRVADQVASALLDRLGDEGVDMVRESLAALIDVLEANVGLLRVVMEELPLRPHIQRRVTLERRVRELVSAYMAARPDLTRSADHERTAWVVVLMLENLCTRFVLDQPGFSREKFIDEVLMLIGGYAAAPAPPVP